MSHGSRRLHSDIKVFERHALLQSRRQLRPFKRLRPIRPERIQASTRPQKPRKEVTKRTFDYLHKLVELGGTRFIARFRFLVRGQLNKEVIQLLTFSPATNYLSEIASLNKPLLPLLQDYFPQIGVGLLWRSAKL